VTDDRQIRPFRAQVPQADLDDLTMLPAAVPTAEPPPHELAALGQAERDNRILHWSELERGGHFPAMEVPELLVGDIRAFFRLVR
jgi:epoxide hydrolase